MIVYGGDELRQGDAKVAIANASTDLAVRGGSGRVPKWDGGVYPPVVFVRVRKLLNMKRFAVYEKWECGNG